MKKFCKKMSKILLNNQLDLALRSTVPLLDTIKNLSNDFFLHNSGFCTSYKNNLYSLTFPQRSSIVNKLSLKFFLCLSYLEIKLAFDGANCLISKFYV